MDKVVIDIETKNSFADVGGRDRVTALDMSFIGAYSYNQDKYFSFREGNFEGLTEFFKKAGLIIGFSINRFDIPILNKYVNFDLFNIERLDLLDEIELAAGRRVGLDILAKANLGIGKTSHGLQAIEFYKAGDWESLEKYCLNDVKITKDLYELAKAKGRLLVPDYITGGNLPVALEFKELLFPQTLF